MMTPTAYLIHCPESFEWHDPDQDHTDSVENFILVHDCATENGDTIYSHDQIWEMQLSWGYFSECLYDDTKCSWLSAQKKQSLAQYLGRQPSKSSLQDVQNEFPTHLCAPIGCKTASEQCEGTFLIYDETTWHEARVQYLSQEANYPLIDWQGRCILANTAYSNQYLLAWIDQHYPQHENQQIKDKLSLFEKELVRQHRAASFIITVGGEILRRNYYQHDPILSSKEKRLSRKLREIYKIQRKNNWQYISLDFENALLEFHDHEGTHLGTYNYCGEQKEPAKPSHNLRCLK